MTTPDKYETGIVVEAYDHDEAHRVLVIRSCKYRMYSFLYVGLVPNVEFGDTIQIDFDRTDYRLVRGNGKLTFKITPLTIPTDVQLKLLSDWLNR